MAASGINRMVSKNKKIAITAALLLIICIVIVAVQSLVFTVPSRPGEGYADPAAAVRITPSGEIKYPTGNLYPKGNSSKIIECDGNVYRLIGNTTSWVVIEKSNIVFDGGGYAFVGTHGLSLERASNITVKDLTVDTHYLHVVLRSVNYCAIQNVSSAFMIRESHHNTISNCSGKIELEDGDYNTVKNCNMGEIILRRSNNNRYLFNTIWNRGPGLGIWKSSNNLIFGNSFEKFWWWISISDGSTNNKIVANNVWGGQIYQEDKLLEVNNYIYHNNFFNFKWDQSKTNNAANVWSMDNRGNYWANFHTGDANNDGVVDSAYIIDKTNKDEYPLMAPVDIATEPLP